MTLAIPRPEALLQRAEGWLLVAACALSAALYAGCFASDSYLAPIAGAAVAGAVVASVSLWRDTSPPRSIVWAVVGWLVYVTAAVLLPTFSGGLPREQTWAAIRDGVVGGWLRLLTTAVPADPTATLLVFPVLVSWWCGWSAATLSWRGHRVLLPVVPALAALLVGLLYGAAGLRPSGWLAASWSLCVLTYLLLRVNRLGDVEQQPGVAAAAAVGLDLAADQRRAFFGRLALGAPSVVFVVIVATLISTTAPVASGAHRFDPRSLVAQPFHVEAAVTPLATLQSQLAMKPPKTLFTLRQSGPVIDRVRVATLSGFDGSTWTAPHDEFLPAGRSLSGERLVQAGQQVTLDVRVMPRAESAFLPVVGQPIALRATGLGYSPRSGTLAARTPPAKGLRYRLTSVLRPYGDLSTSSRIGSPKGLADYLALPPPPPALPDVAAQITTRANTPFARVTQLAVHLRRQPYDPDARPGHSYGAVTRMLVKARPGDQNAFAEQHASAFVVLARLLGIPARVAVGYLVDGKALAAGKEVTVTTGNAHAWPEVPIEGYGWVPFETVDLTKTPLKVNAPDVISAPDDSRVVPVQPGEGNRGAGGLGAPGVGAAILRGSVSAAVVALTLGAAYLLLVLGEKWRRRWVRRRARTSADRVIGAWREAEDRLVERGVRRRRSWTEAETALHASEVIGPPARATITLAPVVNQALFAPEETPEVMADNAWELTRQLRGDLSSSRHLVWRVAAALDPRPLIPAARRSRRPQRRAGSPRTERG